MNQGQNSDMKEGVCKMAKKKFRRLLWTAPDCGLLTTIHHHYKFMSKKILRLLDNLRNAPVSTLNHDLSFVLSKQNKNKSTICLNLF